jgi:hypothetical protein
MAKSQPKPKENISAFFRNEFLQNPDWLDEKSNEKPLGRWDETHPDTDDDFMKSVKQTLANLKSQLRKQRREGTGVFAGGTKTAAPRPQRGRPPMNPQPTPRLAPQSMPQSTPKPSNHVSVSSHRLDPLEEAIDDCLTTAKNLDREGLADVVKLLRKARNEVVWIIGE